MPAKNDSTTILFFSSDATISEANGSSLLSAIRVFPVHNRSVLWIWALQTVTDSIFLSAPGLHAVWCSTAAVLWDVNPSPHFSHSPGELNSTELRLQEGHAAQQYPKPSCHLSTVRILQQPQHSELLWIPATTGASKAPHGPGLCGFTSLQPPSPPARGTAVFGRDAGQESAKYL